MERRADKAGHLRYGLPKSCGGGAASNLAIAAIREHLAAKGLGLHNDLQDESSIVGNFPIIPALADYGTEEQKTYIEGIITGKKHLSFGLTEPGHGSDATWLETTGVRDGDMWVINGRKRWNSQVARAHANLVFARTSGKPGDAKGITAFIVPTDTPGHNVLYNHWTFNMPSDHAETELKDVRVPDSAILHKEGEGLIVAQRFVHENRIRQAAASAGAARYCIQEAVKYARSRVAFGEPLAKKQAVQFPLVELWAEYQMLQDLHLPHRMANGPAESARDQRHGLDLQFPCEPALLRSGRPGHAGAWRHGLQPRPALRAHLPPPSPLPHHRGHGGGPDAPGRAVPVRLRQADDDRMSAVDPRSVLDFDVDALDAWLKDWLGGGARTQARRTEGGMSNPTYFLQRGDWRAVLRKQPHAALAPSAHAIDREFRVLEALQDTPVPVPKPIRYCADRDVLGTPFYLMEWLDGRMFHEFATPGVSPEERAALYRSMCATLAEIHKLDFKALGLEDYRQTRQLFPAPAVALGAPLVGISQGRRRQSRARPHGPVA